MSTGPKNPTDKTPGDKKKAKSIQESMGQLQDQAGKLARRAIQTSTQGTENIESLERRAEEMSAAADAFKKPPKSGATTPVAGTSKAKASPVPPVSPEASSAPVAPLRVTIPTESDAPDITKVTPEPNSPTEVTPSSSLGFVTKLLNATQVFLTMIGYGIREAYNAAAQNWRKAESPATTIAEREAVAAINIAKSVEKASMDPKAQGASVTPTAVTPKTPTTPPNTPEPPSPVKSAKEASTIAAAQLAKRSPAWRGGKAITTQMSAEKSQKDIIDELKHEWFTLQAKRELTLEGDNGLRTYAEKNWGEFSKAPGEINKYNTLKQDIPELFSRLEDKDTPPSSIQIITRSLRDQITQYEKLHTKLEGYVERQNQEISAANKPQT